MLCVSVFCFQSQLSIYQLMDNNDLSILNWNVRGLNDAAHRELVSETVVCSRPNIVCLQETKLSSITPTMALETLGQHLDSYLDLGAQGTRGVSCWHGTKILSQSPMLLTERSPSRQLSVWLHATALSCLHVMARRTIEEKRTSWLSCRTSSRLPQCLGF